MMASSFSAKVEGISGRWQHSNAHQNDHPFSRIDPPDSRIYINYITFIIYIYYVLVMV